MSRGKKSDDGVGSSGCDLGSEAPGGGAQVGGAGLLVHVLCVWACVRPRRPDYRTHSLPSLSACPTGRASSALWPVRSWLRAHPHSGLLGPPQPLGGPRTQMLTHTNSARAQLPKVSLHDYIKVDFQDARVAQSIQRVCLWHRS